MPSTLEHAKTAYNIAGFAAEALQSRARFAALFDHTILKPEATRAQVVRVAEEASEHGFACAMVNPCWVSTAHEVLEGSGVPVGTVLGFPLGASLAVSKRAEAEELAKLGAHDLDMVMAVGLLKSGMHGAVLNDIRGVVEVAHDAGAIVKVILETSLLTIEEKLRASELAIEAGADFLKTSTGFSASGATVADIALMRGVAGARCGVKASGGVRSFAEARAMVEAGANRIGASASVAIVAELPA